LQLRAATVLAGVIGTRGIGAEAAASLNAYGAIELLLIAGEWRAVPRLLTSDERFAEAILLARARGARCSSRRRQASRT
jgi:hypothetical protein